ncbi:hypothetical protein WN48_06074 [Eufriesea mexicana]|nr:hypothetical protein WN48_06074 [Eufriesea mexicana]
MHNFAFTGWLPVTRVSHNSENGDETFVKDRARESLYQSEMEDRTCRWSRRGYE